jgi:hypothetical protein
MADMPPTARRPSVEERVASRENGVIDHADGRLAEGGVRPVGDTTPANGPPARAGNCTAIADQIPDEVAALIEASIAESTRSAYKGDWSHFIVWGGRMPAEPLVASYLAAQAQTLSVATLVRRIATISTAHEASGLPNPCRSEIVRATLRGIKRTRRVAQREVKPLLQEDLFRVLDTTGKSWASIATTSSE